MPILLLSMLLTAPQLVSPPPVGSEVAQMGSVLDRWTGRFAMRGTRATCSTRRSSGDAEIDQVACTAYLDCADGFRSRIVESNAEGLDKAVRSVMKADLAGKMNACIADRRVALIGALAARRAQSAAR